MNNQQLTIYQAFGYYEVDEKARQDLASRGFSSNFLKRAIWYNPELSIFLTASDCVEDAIICVLMRLARNYSPTAADLLAGHIVIDL